MIGVKKEPIDYLTQPIQRFVNSEASIGILLFIASMAAIIVSNSSWGQAWYQEIWHHEISITTYNWSFKMDLHHIINDGLMAVFFFQVGLEIKREFMFGELSTVKKAGLPVAAAIGGMVFPALIYLLLTSGEAAAGWGIPMATDIAFVLGLINLVRNRIARSLKIFITSLAVVDDIGAVLVIAFFYTSDLHPSQLVIAGAALSLLILANGIGIRSATFYSVVGVGGIWLAFFYSGIHPTIAGILIAFTIPATYKIDKRQYANVARSAYDRLINSQSVEGKINTEREDEMLKEIEDASDMARSPLQKLERSIHPYVYFLIMPLFAFANAGVKVESNFLELLVQPVGLGIILGLIIGKSVGISLISRLVVWLRIAQLPVGANWPQVYGAAMLAGIGFTMSLFISELAFTHDILVEEAKMAILVASLLSATLGLLFLRFSKYVITDDRK